MSHLWGAWWLITLKVWIKQSKFWSLQFVIQDEFTDPKIYGCIINRNYTGAYWLSSVTWLTSLTYQLLPALITIVRVVPTLRSNSKLSTMGLSSLTSVVVLCMISAGMALKVMTVCSVTFTKEFSLLCSVLPMWRCPWDRPPVWGQWQCWPRGETVSWTSSLTQCTRWSVRTSAGWCSTRSFTSTSGTPQWSAQTPGGGGAAHRTARRSRRTVRWPANPYQEI